MQLEVRTPDSLWTWLSWSRPLVRRDVNQCLWEVRLLLPLGNELGLEGQIQVASPMLTVSKRYLNV